MASQFHYPTSSAAGVRLCALLVCLATGEWACGACSAANWLDRRFSRATPEAAASAGSPASAARPLSTPRPARDDALPVPARMARSEEQLRVPAPPPMTGSSKAAQPVKSAKSNGTTQPPSPVKPEDATPGDEEEEESDAAASDDEKPAGLLPWLPHECGPITGEYVYTGESFVNARGGLNTNRAVNYRGNLDVVLNFDLEQMGLWSGATFFLYGGNAHGRSMSVNYVGDFQYLSNIDSSPRTYFTQVNEAWWRQELLDGDLWFKLGRQDASADFAFADLGGDFVNSSFTAIPTVVMPIWPFQSLGLSLFGKLTEGITVSGGAYRADLPDNQWGINPPRLDGTIVLASVEWKTQAGADEELPGTWRAGFWHSDADWQEVGDLDEPRTLSGNHGYWISGEQMLAKENCDAGDDQGLAAFGQWGWAPNDRSYICRTYASGLVYRGLWNGRDRDLTGLGFTTVRFSAPIEGNNGSTPETAVELFHKWRCSENVSVQPDLQYIVHPSGLYRDALVFGLRCEMVL